MNRHERADLAPQTGVSGQESADIGTNVPVGVIGDRRGVEATVASGGGFQTHLPECPCARKEVHEGVILICCCDAILAAEQRLTEGWCKAVCANSNYEAGLDAAERGILALAHRDPTTAIQVGENSGLGMAWSVIDELREGKK